MTIIINVPRTNYDMLIEQGKSYDIIVQLVWLYWYLIFKSSIRFMVLILFEIIFLFKITKIIITKNKDIIAWQAIIDSIISVTVYLRNKKIYVENFFVLSKKKKIKIKNNKDIMQ